MPIKTSATIRVRVYPLVSDAVERGIARGWTRAHKYTEKPTEENVREQIESAVLGELAEIFDFEYTDGGPELEPEPPDIDALANAAEYAYHEKHEGPKRDWCRVVRAVLEGS